MSLLLVNEIKPANPGAFTSQPLGSKPLSIKRIDAADNVTIAGGFSGLDTRAEVTTLDSGDFAVDIALNLKTEVNSTGITAPSADTVHYLYLYIPGLGAITTTDNGREVQTASKGVSGAFIVKTETPRNLDDSVYIPIAFLKTNVSSEYTIAEAYAVNILQGGPTDDPTIKVVGTDPGEFASITAASPTAGDRIFIREAYSISSAETVSVDDVHIEFGPQAVITLTAGTEALILTGDNLHVISPQYLINVSGTVDSGIEISGLDCFVDRAKIELGNAGLTLTAAYRFGGSSERGYANGSVKTTSGTLGSGFVDDNLSGANWALVRA